MKCPWEDAGCRDGTLTTVIDGHEVDCGPCPCCAYADRLAIESIKVWRDGASGMHVAVSEARARLAAEEEPKP
jgi:hypothetical protein